MKFKKLHIQRKPKPIISSVPEYVDRCDIEALLDLEFSMIDSGGRVVYLYSIESKDGAPHKVVAPREITQDEIDGLKKQAEARRPKRPNIFATRSSSGTQGSA